MDIGQGAGLAGASGVRPFLPPLLAGALARGRRGLDFSGTDYAFLECRSSVARALLVAGRDRRTCRSAGAARAARPPRVGLGLGALGVALGALQFAGSLADDGYDGRPGLAAASACAALGLAAAAGFCARTRRAARRRGGRVSPRALRATCAALVLAALAVFVPPVSFAGARGLRAVLLV